MKLYKTLLGLLSASFLISCSSTNDVIYKHKDEVDIIVATDTHYISPLLVEEGSALDNIQYNGDGKNMKYVEEITFSFLDEVISKSPDVLILSGDLTFNGEKQSHKDLASKLEEVSDSGISVLVTPGNHDVNNYYASEIKSDSFEHVDKISSEDFKDIYAESGYNTSAFQDPNSLSYISKITDDLWVFMLDTNKYEGNGTIIPSYSDGEISPESMDWIEEHLILAKEANVEVLAVTHHNILDHNKLFTDGFTIDNNTEVVDLLTKYGVNLNLSGHLHIQDVKIMETSNDVIADVVTTALSVYPHQYGEITFKPNDSFEYITERVNVESWAKENNITDENLLNFDKYSVEHFFNVSLEKNIASLSEHYQSESDLFEIASLLAEVNTHYFAGTVDKIYDETINSTPYLTWLNNGDITNKSYILSILEDRAFNQNSVVIGLTK